MCGAEDDFLSESSYNSQDEISRILLNMPKTQVLLSILIRIFVYINNVQITSTFPFHSFVASTNATGCF